jgi:hypothetical protein
MGRGVVMAVLPPISVIDRDGWLTMFASIAEAEASLEAPDVEDDEYLGFDAEGRRLILLVDDRDPDLPWYRRLRHQSPVRIVDSPEPPDPVHLRSILQEALADAGALSGTTTLHEMATRAHSVATAGTHLRARGARRRTT